MRTKSVCRRTLVRGRGGRRMTCLSLAMRANYLRTMKRLRPLIQKRAWYHGWVMNPYVSTGLFNYILIKCNKNCVEIKFRWCYFIVVVNGGFLRDLFQKYLTWICPLHSSKGDWSFIYFHGTLKNVKTIDKNFWNPHFKKPKDGSSDPKQGIESFLKCFFLLPILEHWRQ